MIAPNDPAPAALSVIAGLVALTALPNSIRTPVPPVWTDDPDGITTTSFVPDAPGTPAVSVMVVPRQLTEVPPAAAQVLPDPCKELDQMAGLFHAVAVVESVK